MKIITTKAMEQEGKKLQLSHFFWESSAHTSLQTSTIFLKGCSKLSNFNLQMVA